MISENIFSFIKPESDRKKFDKFKEFEFEQYKKMHRSVLNDDGTPTFKKTAFKMPGYRKVLDEPDS